MAPRVEIASLKEGSNFDQSFLLASAQVMTAKNGKSYGALTLMDASGQVQAKMWDRAEETLSALKPGQVVTASGRVDSYQGRKQLIINRANHLPEASTAEFLPASPVPLLQLEQRLECLLAEVKCRHLRKLLNHFFRKDEDFAQNFKTAPAAKGAHHDYVHGLLEHTVCVGENCLNLARSYEEIDRDLLIAGALLHDIGKTAELTIGPPIDYTEIGRLEGHIAIGMRMIDEALRRFKSFPPELAGHVRHLVLSHHGRREFGSPVEPMTPEAFLLNMADDIDAKMRMMRDARDEAEEGQVFSGYNRLLERYLYVAEYPWRENKNGDKACQAEPPTPGLFDLGGGG